MNNMGYLYDIIDHAAFVNRSHSLRENTKAVHVENKRIDFRNLIHVKFFSHAENFKIFAYADFSCIRKLFLHTFNFFT